MKSILDKISEYEKRILAEKEFIKAPNSYIFDMTEIEAEGEFTEYLRAIEVRNSEILVDKKNKIDAIHETLASLDPITIKETEQTPTSKAKTTPSLEQKKDLTNYIKLLEDNLFEDSTMTLLKSITAEDLIRLKLYFLRKQNIIKRQIRLLIMQNPTNSINELQNQIVQCELIMELLIQVEKEEQKQEEKEELSNIILVPDLKNHNSFLYSDILRYPENKKEIKTAIDKVLDGYFLKTKDTKMIENFREHKLYEYKHPNGIRILYIVNNGYIFICSIFYKDKQKSIRITNYYEEAINRFYASLDYIKGNINNPDFFIEQDEYIANINTILEQGISLSKKVGE